LVRIQPPPPFGRSGPRSNGGVWAQRRTARTKLRRRACGC